MTQEITEEADFDYLERKRLEDEFRKLKELKFKAEQFAVEAKQTALRLDSENKKVKEDLSKERQDNEITRNKIIHETEQRVTDNATTDKESMAAKLNSFEQVVQDKAYQLLHRMPNNRDSYVKGKLILYIATRLQNCQGSIDSDIIYKCVC